MTRLVPRGGGARPEVNALPRPAENSEELSTGDSPEGRYAPAPLWFVTLTISGEALAPPLVRAAMERLAQERPFLVSTRYCADRVELRYWEESDEASGAVLQALKLWSDHRKSAHLPDWRVVGIEAVDRATTRRRWDRGDDPRVLTLGEIRPLDLDA